MKIPVTLQIEDYIHQFYQLGAERLNRSPESLMEQALFIYAGLIADDINRTVSTIENSQL